MSEMLRILVVDDDPMMTRTLVDILRVKGYEAEAAYSGAEALQRLAEGVFDCVLTDIKMPEADGVTLCRAIKTRQPDLPVVLMTAYTTHERVREGLDEGAIAVLAKPLDINALLSFFSVLRKERTVVIVDDDPEFVRTLGAILRARGFTVIPITTDPLDIIERIKENGQVILLDMKLDDISGLEVLRAIRVQYPFVPVILVTGYLTEMGTDIKAALQIKAVTCLYKPLQIEELIQTLTAIRRQELRQELSNATAKR